MRTKYMFLVMILSSTLYTADRSQKPLTPAAFLSIEPGDTDAEIMEKMARLMRQDAGVDNTDDEDLIVLSPVVLSSFLLSDNGLLTMQHFQDEGDLTPDATSCIGPWSTHTVQEPVRVYPRLCAVAVQQSMLVVAGAGPQLASVDASTLARRREQKRLGAQRHRAKKRAEKEQAEQEARAQAFAASVAARSFVPLSIPPITQQNSLECPEALTSESVALSEQVPPLVAVSAANTRTGVSLVCPHCKVTFAYETCFKKHMGTTSDPHKTCPILLKQWRLQARDGSKKQ